MNSNEALDDSNSAMELNIQRYLFNLLFKYEYQNVYLVILDDAILNFLLNFGNQF